MLLPHVRVHPDGKDLVVPVAVYCSAVHPHSHIQTTLIHYPLNTNIPFLAPFLAFKLVQICFMLSTACTRRRASLSSLGGWLASLGALSFVVSDAVLGFDKFAPPALFAGLWFWQPFLLVMSTYYAAQILIAASTLCDDTGAAPIKAKVDKTA